MARIPLAEIPNAPGMAPMPTGGNLGGVDLSRATSLMRREGIQPGSFDGPAKGLQSIGQAIQEGGGVLEKLAVHKAQADADVAISKAQDTMRQSYSDFTAEIAQKPGSDTNQWATDVQKRLSETSKKLLEDPTLSHTARQHITRNAEHFILDSTSNIKMAAAKESFSRASQSFQHQGEQQLLSNDIEGYTGTIASMVQRQHIPPELAGDLIKSGASRVSFQATMILANEDPKALRERLNDPEAKPITGLNPIQLQKVKEETERNYNVKHSDAFQLAYQMAEAGKVTDPDHAVELMGGYADATDRARLERIFKEEIPLSYEAFHTVELAVSAYDPAKDTSKRGEYDLRHLALTTLPPGEYRQNALKAIDDKLGNKPGSALSGDISTALHSALKDGLFGQWDASALKDQRPESATAGNLFGARKSAQEKWDIQKQAKERAVQKMLQAKTKVMEFKRINPKATDPEVHKFLQDVTSAPAETSAAGRIQSLFPPPVTPSPNGSSRPSPADVPGRVRAILDGRPAPGGSGKITIFGYPGDSTPDNNSRHGIGAFVPREEEEKIRRGEDSDYKLREGDIAVSPDKHAELKAAGVKPYERITLTLSDGDKHTGRLADLTANDKKASELGLAPLRGRWDIYNRDGKHPKNGVKVVSWTKA